jgi:ring-1,2-phenylacetyl-CoA epoxidase subunit PaaC
MMNSSIEVKADPAVQYLLRIGDACLIHGQRIAEWCGHAPVLEEDIAMSNMALDLIGQARAVLKHAGDLEGVGHDEDQLAFLREERAYLNPTLVELPRGDFAFTVLRNAVMATFFKLLWEGLTGSTDEVLAGIAGKALKESRYHQQHAADWLVRLGDGTAESHRRVESAVHQLWLYTPELFENDSVDDSAQRTGLGPRWGDLKAAWQAEIDLIFGQAHIDVPSPSTFRSTGKKGVHSEHMGYMLAEMQHLQRSFPGGMW